MDEIIFKMYINISSRVYSVINNSVNIYLTRFKYIYIIVIVYLIMEILTYERTLGKNNNFFLS